MPWGRLDDSLYDHPKLDLLPAGERLSAVGLWARAISWCNRFLTDGHVPRDRVVKLDGTLDLADRLVVAGLWEPAAHGYQIHDFLEFNDSREKVEKRRVADAERKAQWRAERDAAKNGTKPSGRSHSGTPRAKRPAVTAGVTPESQVESQRDSRTRESRPDPSRPNRDTTPPTPSPARGRKRRTNGPDPGQYDALTQRDTDSSAEMPDWADAPDAPAEPVEAKP